MKIAIKSNPVYNSTIIPDYKKLNNHLVKPLKSGFLGFTTILMIIIILNLLSFVIGSNEQFRIDFLDFQLAGVGFLLQTTGASLKSFIR